MSSSKRTLGEKCRGLHILVLSILSLALCVSLGSPLAGEHEGPASGAAAAMEIKGLIYEAARGGNGQLILLERNGVRHIVEPRTHLVVLGGECYAVLQNPAAVSSCGKNADLNKDGKVDISDFSALQDRLGTTGSEDLLQAVWLYLLEVSPAVQFDLDGNGLIDQRDKAELEQAVKTYVDVNDGSSIDVRS